MINYKELFEIINNNEINKNIITKIIEGKIINNSLFQIYEFIEDEENFD